MTPRTAWRQMDWGFLFLLALLCGVGLTVLWSASHGPDGRVAAYAAKQARWMAIGGAVLAAALTLDYRRLESWAPWIYVGTLVALVAVLVAGHTTMGAQRWIGLGPLRVQPSEFAKISIAIVTAHALAREPSDPPYGLRPLLLPAAMVGLACLLVLLQPDLGTAVLMAGVAGVQILFQGVRRGILLGGLGAAAVGLPAAWGLLHDYQRQRILTFLDPERDPLGAGYHIIQSKIAVGSGQFLGKGFLRGTQAHLRFLPERHTDFIFSVLAEEWGFLGAAVVLVLFALWILWGLDIASRARDDFGRLLAVGLTSILFFHVLVNVGMVLGLLPVVGVPLPLFSYGGSSVVTTFLICGLLLSIRMRRFGRF